MQARGSARNARVRRKGIRRRSASRSARNVGAGARARLRGFRQATIVAVAVTGFLLLLLAPAEAVPTAERGPPPAGEQGGPAAQQLPDTVSVIEDIPVDSLQVGAAGADDSVAAVRADTLVRAAQVEARRTVRNLWYGFLGALPKVLVVIATLFLAWLIVRLVRPLLRRILGEWQRASAATAIFGICVWLLAVGIAVSVLAGDIRALVGSFGLVGLALSWALQTPIESFTGWLMNSFQGYYRVGDRVAVGDALGDVYRIDFLTTTVWEIGGISRPGFVNAEQPTGRLITFPNSEVLSGSVVNLTRDFPYVWDELSVPVANTSDLAYAGQTLMRVASGIIGDYMRGPARQYEAILERARLEVSVADTPQVFVSLEESWTTLTVRYLVGARERRIWKSRLAQAVNEELKRPEHAERIHSAYPRHQVQLLDAAEHPVDGPAIRHEAE